MIKKKSLDIWIIPYVFRWKNITNSLVWVSHSNNN